MILKNCENPDSTAQHLGYCTNIHAAESWPEMHGLLSQLLPAIRDASCHGKPLGLGLRLAASAAHDLAQETHYSALQEMLGSDYYVYTINGFPYGTFHNSPVKEQVYAPDWSDQARLQYSNQLADLLARLLPDGEMGTISTVPGTFKAWVPGRIEPIRDQLLAHVAHLIKIEQNTGRHIMMTLEPEPCCMLETIQESIDFFNQHLFSERSVNTVAASAGITRTEAATAVRRHLGLCYDVCHAAVEFEDPVASIRALQAAEIAIGKLQISSALRLANVSASTPEFLAPFDEPVYLHQVIQKKGNEITRFVDLGDALASIDQAIGSEWRCHFHVPVFLAELQDFSTTQDFLKQILALQKAQPFTSHLEIETYTWDVLPGEYRNVPISAAIARELNWVKQQLGMVN